MSVKPTPPRVQSPEQVEIQKLRGLILETLELWWPFVHGRVGASNAALNLRKKLSDGVQPGDK